MQKKQDIIVLFGGPTVEHDVTIVTAQEVIAALDPTRFTALPVYWAPDGQFYTGEALLLRRAYPFTPAKITELKLQRVTFALGLKEPITGRPALQLSPKYWWQKPFSYGFDCIIPVAHGTMVEDGQMQGVYGALGAPFVGSGLPAASVFMSKESTKQLLRAANIAVLPSVLVERPRHGFADIAAITAALTLPFDFPVIIKPNYLGSSIGVTRATTTAELQAGIAKVFKLDTAALIEPCVEPLVEYNISASHAFGNGLALSAIERPLTSGELLDFDQKYKSGGGKKGSKRTGKQSDKFVVGNSSMATATRVLNPPELTPQQHDFIATAARVIMNIPGAKGAPRIDFIGNKNTGEIWVNEVNPIPGSFAYFLWEQAADGKSFTELLTALVTEAISYHRATARQTDASIAGGGLF